VWLDPWVLFAGAKNKANNKGVAMSSFSAVDNANASTFLRSVNQSDGSFSEHLLMPITGFENNGLPVFPKGFDKAYDLYLMIDATGKGVTFDSLNLTLWADPKANDGTPSVSKTNDPAFTNGTRGDIALATGTLVSAHLSLDAAGARHADFVETMTPTFAGTILSDGSLKAGGLLEEQLLTPPAAFTSSPQPDGTTITVVNGGTAKIDVPSFDSVQYQNNLFSTIQADGTYLAHRIDPVTGMTLNGALVTPPGFGTAYGLYFDIADTGVSTPTSLTFASSSFKLMYDPGNQDGAVTSTVNGISFADTGPNGAADDIVLGTGTMVSGVPSLNPATGIRTTHFVENFVPTAGLAALSPFVSSPAVFDLVNSGAASLLVNNPGPNGTVLQTINGGTGVAKSAPAIGAGDTILVPNIGSGLFQPHLGFIHSHGPHGRGKC
jgi:hypothetical protein